MQLIAANPLTARVVTARALALRRLLEARVPGGWWSSQHDVNAVPAALFSVLSHRQAELFLPPAGQRERWTEVGEQVFDPAEVYGR